MVNIAWNIMSSCFKGEDGGRDFQELWSYLGEKFVAEVEKTIRGAACCL